MGAMLTCTAPGTECRTKQQLCDPAGNWWPWHPEGMPETGTDTTGTAKHKEGSAIAINSATATEATRRNFVIQIMVPQLAAEGDKLPELSCSFPRVSNCARAAFRTPQAS